MAVGLPPEGTYEPVRVCDCNDADLIWRQQDQAAPQWSPFSHLDVGLGPGATSTAFLLRKLPEPLPLVDELHDVLKEFFMLATAGATADAKAKAVLDRYEAERRSERES